MCRQPNLLFDGTGVAASKFVAQLLLVTVIQQLIWMTQNLNLHVDLKLKRVGGNRGNGCQPLTDQ